MTDYHLPLGLLIIILGCLLGLYVSTFSMFAGGTIGFFSGFFGSYAISKVKKGK